MTRSRDVADTQDNLGGAVAPFVAGKNKIINGDFYVNQRNFSSVTTDGSFGYDRWFAYVNAGVGATYSAQTFTPGTAPVVGYEGKNFARLTTTGQSGAGVYTILLQRIEDVRTFAGQTATISFWAKAASGTPKVSVEMQQFFGSGGSSSVFIAAPVSVTISTSWTRYSITVSFPSIAGKTIGTGSCIELNMWVSAGTDYNARTGSLGVQNNTFDFWGVQVEAGSVATPFTTASGSIGGELALCQRYYFRNGGLASYTALGNGTAESSTAIEIQVAAPVTMRTLPTAVDYSTIAVQPYGTGTITAVTSAVLGTVKGLNPLNVTLNVASGLTQGVWSRGLTNNSTSGYLAFSAEL